MVRTIYQTLLISIILTLAAFSFEITEGNVRNLLHNNRLHELNPKILNHQGIASVQVPIDQNEPDYFSYQFFCPINNILSLVDSGNKYFKDVKLEKDLYVVFIRAFNNSNTTMLNYCGYVRDGTQCNDTINYCCNSETVRQVCTFPGPVFYIPVKRQIDVVWIHDIDSDKVSLDSTIKCFDQADPSSNPYCKNDAKNDKWDKCTYFSPTNLDNTINHQMNTPTVSHKQETIGIKNIPITTHVHGLQVRPTFDGNPLTWMNGKSVGVGFMSSENTAYYNQTNKIQTNISDFQKIFRAISNKYNKTHNQIKINRYPNDQPPGNLWYHDHGMRATKFTVKSGLAGMYILYDPKVQKQLPPLANQRFILLAESPVPTSQKKGVDMNPNPDKKLTFISSEIVPFKRGKTYRFRLLNSNFQSIWSQISFIFILQKCEKSPCEQAKNVESNTSLKDYDWSKLTFTVIGTDSTLKREPVAGVNIVSLAPSERVQLLIKFSGENIIPKQVSKIYLINKKGDSISVFQKLQLQNVTYRQDDFLPIKSLDVPFTDITRMDESPSISRMRPLMRTKDFTFVINGHPEFMEGGVENPQIGTVENYYFINTIPIPHPIHVHLITYQIFSKYSLITLSDDTNKNLCTCYEIDFLRGSTKFIKFLQNKNPSLDITNNSAICSFIRTDNSWNSQNMNQYFKDLYLQDQFINITRVDQKGKTNHSVSGLDLFKLYDESDPYQCPSFDSKEVCNTWKDGKRRYKYICNDLTKTIPQWQKGYKEVALVNEFTALGIKIRWAKTDYNEIDQKNPNSQYFNLPESTLIQFPGYVYHCHILGHEDKEMMRPIMLRPSKKNLTTDWAKLQQTINKKLNCSLST